MPLAEPRRRGGYRQQRERGDDMPAEFAGRPSLLMSKLLLKWADGFLHATELQDLAAAAQRDGLAHPMVARLAALRPGNWAHSSLMKLLLGSSLAGAITQFPDHEATEMILPSRWLHLLHSYPHEFRSFSERAVPSCGSSGETS